MRKLAQRLFAIYTGTTKSKNIGILGSLQLLHTALSVDVEESSPHWVLDCSPFPLLFVLSQLLDQTLRCVKVPQLQV